MNMFYIIREHEFKSQEEICEENLIYLENEYNEIENEEKIIINTHLGLNKEERQTQISEILNFAKLQNNDVVICGDFNEENINLGSYKDVAQCLYEDFNPTFKKSRIDYAFVSKMIKINSYKVDQVFYSDHFPIIVEV